MPHTRIATAATTLTAANSPFAPGWWFRTQFATPANAAAVTLHFEGISYRGSIYLNGQQIATPTDVAGTFRRYDFDITKYLSSSGMNALAVEVTAQTPKDLGLDFLDWNPAATDRYMGLLRKAHRDDNLDGVMCRDLVSVDWRGYLYDCDFNQMLDLPLTGADGARRRLEDLLTDGLDQHPIQVAGHCYGCTAGQGSSCGGALKEAAE